MTFPDDGRDEPGRDAPEGGGLPLDEDAAWRAIVDNYGERADLGVTDTAPPPVEPAAPNVFDTGYLDAQTAENDRAAASWSDEGHFVPPEPPPVPSTTPARRLAWIGLFGAPLLLLVAVIFPVTYPTWFAMGLVGAFVGGFVFLVATMERHDGDGWGGDDGAVV